MTNNTENSLYQSDTLESQFLTGIQSGSLTEIQALLKKFEPLKENPIVQFLFNETFSSEGFLAIHIASKNNHTDLVRFLIENGANTDVVTTKSPKRNALQLSIALQKLAALIELIPYSDTNKLSKTEFRALLLQLINTKQAGAIDTLLNKTNSKPKKSILSDWMIENEYCLTYALRTDKECFSILLKHGANPFYIPFFSSSKTAFAHAAKDSNSLDAAYQMLMSQTKVDDYDRINCFMSHCIAKKQDEKTEKSIAHLAESAGSASQLSHSLFWHPCKKQTLISESISANSTVFLESMANHLPIYLQYVSSTDILNLLAKEKYDLVSLIFSTYRRYPQLIRGMYELCSNQGYQPALTVEEVIVQIIKANHFKLFAAFHLDSLWANIIDNSPSFLFMAAEYSVKILSLLVPKHVAGKSAFAKWIFPDGTQKALTPNSAGEKLIDVAARTNKACYDYLLDFYQGEEIPLFDNPILKNQTANSTIDSYTQIEISENNDPQQNNNNNNNSSEKNKYLAKDSPILHTTTEKKPESSDAVSFQNNI